MLSKKLEKRRYRKTCLSCNPTIPDSMSVVTESLHDDSIEQKRDVNLWADLPIEILQRFSDRVPALEFTSFQNVCKAWKLVKPRLEPNTLVWGVGESKDDPNWRSFYYVDPQSERITSEVQFPPMLTGINIVGSSYGWLVTMKATEVADRFECRLINVYKMACIKLPVYQGGGFPMIWASMVPTDPECIFLLMNTLSTYPDILFCKQRDEEWRITGCANPMTLFPAFLLTLNGANLTRHMHYSVAATNGKFYILHKSSFGRNGSCIDVLSSPATITPFDYSDRPMGEQNFHRYHFLVESGGDLLLVFLHREGEELEITNIEILRFDLLAMEWTKIETIGDQVLFLGMNGSFSHSSGEIGMSRGDYIYYPLYEENGIWALWDVPTSSTIVGRYHDVITAKHQKTNWAWISSSLHDSDGLATDVTEASWDNGNRMAGNSTEFDAVDNQD